jgi:lipocalin
MLIVLEIVPLVIPFIPAPATYAQQSIFVPELALVKLWSWIPSVQGIGGPIGSVGIPMHPEAKIYRDFDGTEYVVYCRDRPCDVSRDGRYISVGRYGADALAIIFKVKTGEVVGTISNYSGGVWEIKSWNPFKVKRKVTSYAGYFSADGSKFLPLQIWGSGGGTAVRGVNRTSDWSTIPVDWGFSDNNICNYGAVQFDYEGHTLIVGYPPASALYIYHYDATAGKYIRTQTIQKSERYGFAAFMTLDGAYILVGGPRYNYIDIYGRTPSGYELLQSVYLGFGVNGIAVSDEELYNSYILLLGDRNFVVAYFRRKNPHSIEDYEFKIISSGVAPPGVASTWLWPSRYQRGVGTGRQALFAVGVGAADFRPRAFVYDILSNKTYSFEVYRYGGAPSPSGDYAYLGTSMYLIVRRGLWEAPEGVGPRLRLWGTLRFSTKQHYLSSDLVLAPPEDLKMFPLQGKLTVTKLYTEPVYTSIVTDPTIASGKLALMAGRGLVSASVIDASYVSIDSLNIAKGYEFEDILRDANIPEQEQDNYIATLASLKFNPPPYFWEGNAYYATRISVPFNQVLPLYILKELYMKADASIHVTAALHDSKSVLSVYGTPIIIGSGTGISSKVLSTIAIRILLSKLATQGIYSTSLATAASAAKISGYVGIAIAIWGAVDFALATWGGYGTVNTQTWVVITPVIYDNAGRKYAAIQFYLPSSESTNIGTYYNTLKQFLVSLGYADVGFRATYIGTTWDAYRAALEKGSLPPLDLCDLITATIPPMAATAAENLYIAGAEIIIINRVYAKETFWQWLFGLGGVQAAVATLVEAATIKVEAALSETTIADPNMIANLVGSAVVNGVPFSVKPGTKGAEVEFYIPEGYSELRVSFPKALKGMKMEALLEAYGAIISPFSDKGFYYTTTVDYNWAGTAFALDRIELVDMYYPAVLIERSVRYKDRELYDDITQHFVSTKVSYPQSPTGYLYHYVSTSTLRFDVADGGLLQPGKSFTVNYFYRSPPDVAIKLFINGTKTASTLAHHATVVLINRAPAQNVSIVLQVLTKYRDGWEEVAITNRTIYDTVPVPSNGTSYRVYDVADAVYRAVEFMNATGKPAYVEIHAKIAEARYNYLKSNDEDRVVYYPPPTIPGGVPGLRGNYTVTARVVELDNKTYTWRPSANALVEVLMGDVLVSESYTNASGYAGFVLSGGTYTFRASKPGYTSDSVTMTINENSLITLYLIPGAGATPRVTDNETYIFVNATSIKVAFYVYNASSGKPVAGATIRLTYVEPADSRFYGKIFTATTDADGAAVLETPTGRYRLEVCAAGFKNHTSYVSISKDTAINIALEPLTTPPGYYVLEVYTYYLGREFPMPDVNISITGDNVNITAKTDSRGYAMFVLKGGVTYTVKATALAQGAKPYTLTKTVTLTENETVVFEFPWRPSPFPIGRASIAVDVAWKNGKPFQGAAVCIVNATSGAKIACDYTDSTGQANFIVPAFQVYYVTVDAVNPYNTSQAYHESSLLDLTASSVSGGMEFVTLTGFKMEFAVPWAPPGMPEYRLVVYAYDALTATGIKDVSVVVTRGSEVWFARTNDTGYARIALPYLGLFEVTASHPLYKTVTRSVIVIENNTLINLPMVPIPANFTLPVLPPANGTYPAVVINNVSYYWLSVQVTWGDGYPFHGAEVRVYNTTSGELIARGVTNGTGFVHFLIRANASIRYTVDAVNPYNTSQVYTAEKILTMSQHYFFVHTLPWISKYFAPEVAVVNVDLATHRGLGYFYGNVSHAVLYSIWTNKPQNVSVFIALYNVSSDEPKLINSKVANISLTEGVNTFIDWISANITSFTLVRAFVNITRWQYDTDPGNNYAWSPPRMLRPFTNFYAVLCWRPKQVKQSWSLLPEDTIEIDVGVYIPINTTSIPLMLNYSISYKNLTIRAYRDIAKRFEELRAVKGGMIWRNLTLAVPWTSHIVINISASHELDDNILDNSVSTVIDVSPNIKLDVAGYTSYVTEGGDIKIAVRLKNNVDPELGAIAWITVEDNRTAKILLRQGFVLDNPDKTAELKLKAPENPTMFWFIRKPTDTHPLNITVVGYDVYDADDSQGIKVTVVSYQWIVAVIAIAVIIIIIVAISRAIRKSIAMSMEEEMEFVKRKRYVHSKS